MHVHSANDDRVTALPQDGQISEHQGTGLLPVRVPFVPVGIHHIPSKLYSIQKTEDPWGSILVKEKIDFPPTGKGIQSNTHRLDLLYAPNLCFGTLTAVIWCQPLNRCVSPLVARVSPCVGWRGSTAADGRKTGVPGVGGSALYLQSDGWRRRMVPGSAPGWRCASTAETHMSCH